MPERTPVQKRVRSQWAAQFLVAAELTRQGYVVAFTMGNSTPIADLLVGDLETGQQFWVDVKGLSLNSPWLISKKPDHPNLFYVLVRVGDSREADRFFILSQAEMNATLDARSRERSSTDHTDGFPFAYAEPFEGKWDTLRRLKSSVCRRAQP